MKMYPASFNPSLIKNEYEWQYCVGVTALFRRISRFVICKLPNVSSLESTFIPHIFYKPVDSKVTDSIKSCITLQQASVSADVRTGCGFAQGPA